MNATDRRRLAFAIVFTVLALPALWVFSRDRRSTSGADAAGAVGVDSPLQASAMPRSDHRPTSRSRRCSSGATPTRVARPAVCGPSRACTGTE